MKKFVVILLCVMALASCAKESEESGKPVVAASIVPEATFIEKVAGDTVEVLTVIPPGFSPENYEPAPREKEAFAKAEIYFRLEVEAEDAAIMPSVGENTSVVNLAAAVREVYPDLRMGEGRDPHIWLSVKRVKVMVGAICEVLSEHYPSNKDLYERNAAAFIEELDAADEEIHALLDECENKTMIVFHPAFGYFADEYGLEMFALEEEGKESSARHMAEMIDLARDAGAKAIFYQEEVDSRQSETFAREIGGRAVMLSPLASNYTENLILMASTIKEDAEK